MPENENENENEMENEMEITTITLTREQQIRIVNTSELHKVLAQILKRENIIDREKEHFWFIGFNSQNYILCIDTVSLGTVLSTQILPMNVFRNGVAKGCTHAILSHNHPSGVLEPSDNDIDITDRLYQCGDILNIPIEDHLIITVETYISFKDQKIMAKIEKSTKYVPQFKLKERWAKEGIVIRNKALEEGIDIGKLEEKIEIAKSMLADNIDIKIISKHTGFTKEEIEKLM